MATKVKAKKKVARRGRTSTSRVSSKNQVTIPVDILRKAGIKEGDEVSFAVNEKNEIELKHEKRQQVLLLIRAEGSNEYKDFDLDKERETWERV